MKRKNEEEKRIDRQRNTTIHKGSEAVPSRTKKHSDTQEEILRRGERKKQAKRNQHTPHKHVLFTFVSIALVLSNDVPCFLRW
jgi:hypothetical protein